jgi:hypothetical protein
MEEQNQNFANNQQQPGYQQPPQPQYQQPNPNQVPPKTWLVESILVTILCCLPFGIAGIVNASNVESRFYAGDYAGSMRASQEAGKWTKIGFWVGLSASVLVIIFYVLFIAFAVSLNGFR